MDMATTRPQGMIDPAAVKGWGVDADPDNDPTYPYRDRSEDDHSGQWQRPSQQPVEVEVLQSIEHKQRPAVVGTTVPPSGLSGAMRRLAFRWSESNLTHWMLLLAADRVNMVEGLFDDLVGRKGKGGRGKEETGSPRPEAFVKVGLFAGAVAVGWWLLARRR